MGEFSTVLTGGTNRGLLSPAGNTPLGVIGMSAAGLYGNTTTVWTANRAVYAPILVNRPVTVYTLQIRVQTQNGNVDAGIYTWNNTKVVSIGSTACAAAGIQQLDIADTLLAPGWYKIAFASSSSTAVFRCCSGISILNLRVSGVQEQASAFALPDPITPVAYATAVMPMIVATYKTTF